MEVENFSHNIYFVTRDETYSSIPCADFVNKNKVVRLQTGVWYVTCTHCSSLKEFASYFVGMTPFEYAAFTFIDDELKAVKKCNDLNAVLAKDICDYIDEAVDSFG